MITLVFTLNKHALPLGIITAIQSYYLRNLSVGLVLYAYVDTVSYSLNMELLNLKVFFMKRFTLMKLLTGFGDYHSYNIVSTKYIDAEIQKTKWNTKKQDSSNLVRKRTHG